MLHALLSAAEETLFMVFAAGFLSLIIGLPLSVMLVAARVRLPIHNPFLHKILRLSIDAACSMPYLILMIAVIPLTGFVLGTKTGSIQAILPLTLAAIPQFTQYCAKTMHKIPKVLIESVLIMGASPWQITRYVLLPESLPGIIQGFTRTLIHLLGYSVVAGALGSGGLGGLAMQKGYTEFHMDYILAVLLILFILVQILQYCGNYLSQTNNANQDTL